jgi:SNF2 family DNA or RNA helicase
VYNIIARDTMDEAVIQRTDEKASVQDAFLAAMKRRVT